jgi:hypothetical protein
VSPYTPAASLDAATRAASQGFRSKAAASLVAAAVAGEGGTRGGVMVLLAELTRAELKKVTRDLIASLDLSRKS